jgi:sugar lactone lactonase YvrE
MKRSRLGTIFGALVLTLILTKCSDPYGPYNNPLDLANMGVNASSAGNARVTISWTAISGATSYNLYWSTANGVTKTSGTKITGVTSPYTQTGLTNGTTYYYVVTAVITGMESPASKQVNATPCFLITTLAGNGTDGYSGDGSTATSAELNQPWDVALDSSGNLYIADASNNRIRKITAATGIITTVAGNGTSGYSGDGGAATSVQLCFPEGVALDASGNLYIADSGNNRIREVTASTGIITTVAGNGTAGYTGDGDAATSAELNEPIDVALDSSSNLYIVDQYNNRIRKVTASTGIITTVAGKGTAGYSGDGGAATSAELYFRWHGRVALDASGNIYIVDNYNCLIRKVTASTGIITTVVGNGTCGYSGDGGAALSAQLAYPTALALDASGNLYIADQGNNRIRQVTVSTGIISTVAGNGTEGYSGDGGAAISAEFDWPEGIALDSSGKLYIADTNNNRIRKVY